MKRAGIWIIALALVLAFALCACGTDGETDTAAQGGEEVGTVPQKNVVGDNAADARGSIADGVYENAYFGIACALDGDWELIAEDRLSELGGEVQNAAYDMYAIGGGGLYAMNVVVDDIGAKDGVMYDEEGYTDKSLELIESAEPGSYAPTAAEKREVTFAGERHYAVYSTGQYVLDEFRAADVYQLAVCVKNGRYVAIVTFMSFFEDKTAQLSEMWYNVNP